MAYTAPRTWVSSEVVTAAIMNQHVRDNFLAVVDRLQCVRKSTDEAVPSSTALQNDNELLFTVAAGQSYDFTIVLILQCASQTPDLKFGFSFPTGTMDFGVHGLDLAATSPTGSATIPAARGATTGTTTLAVAAGGDSIVIIEGSYSCTTSGTVTLQWAQNTSNASSTIVSRGSKLRAIRVAA